MAPVLSRRDPLALAFAAALKARGWEHVAGVAYGATAGQATTLTVTFHPDAELLAEVAAAVKWPGAAPDKPAGPENATIRSWP